jgi:outer membrane protein with glycine zipper
MNQPHDPKLKPITGQSSPHPMGTGIGAAGGAMAGAAVGTSVGGPVGAVVGGAVGAAAGALAGRSAAEAINPTVEDAYWSANYLNRDYIERHRPYTDYRPAYQYGWKPRARLGNRPFHDVESELERGWDLAKGESKLVWTQAKHAVNDAWHRLECAGSADAAHACH